MATLHSPLRRTAPEAAGCAAPEDAGPELAALSLKLAPLAGAAFVDEFARAATAASGADCLLIGRLNAYSNVMRSVRLIEDGVLAPNITYSLDGTPCARAIDSDTCVYNSDVAAQFPLDRQLTEMGITGYVGTPLRDEAGCPLGVIVALARKPFARPALVSAIFERFRDRVAREIVTLETLERYSLAECGDTGIWDWDLLTGNMLVSRSVARMLGHGGDGREHDLRLIDEAIHPDDRAIKSAALARHMRGGEPFDVLVRLRNKDGVYRWFRMLAEAVRNDKGAAVRMVGCVSDVDALVIRSAGALNQQLRRRKRAGLTPTARFRHLWREETAAMSQTPRLRSTTILAVRRDGIVAIGGDGQVSLGASIVKGDARKIRRLAGGKVVAGFAGGTADAFTLLERLEAKLEQYPGQLTRAAVELAKDWRTDRYLRRLEAMMIVADPDVTLTLTGAGDVIEPEHGIAAIGSGGDFARAAARALFDETDLPAEAIVRKAMAVAASICVYTNHSLIVETLSK